MGSKLKKGIDSVDIYPSTPRLNQPVFKRSRTQALFLASTRHCVLTWYGGKEKVSKKVYMTGSRIQDYQASR